MSGRQVLICPDCVAAATSEKTDLRSDNTTDAARLTSADTDGSLAREYLYGSGLSAKSTENYQKEIYRFLRYCQVNNLALRDLKVVHIKAFSEFLRDPQPASEWVSSTKHARTIIDAASGVAQPNPLWRPFSGPLSEASRRQAMAVVKAFMQYAQDTGYLLRNPAALVRAPRQERPAHIERYLPAHMIDFVFSTLEASSPTIPPQARRHARDLFLLTAWWTTGCRLAEIVSATMGATYREPDGRWWLDVIGKGAKRRRVPLPPEFLDAFRRYRMAFGMKPDTYKGDPAPLVMSTRHRDQRAVSDEAAANAIKAVFQLAARKAAELGEATMAAHLGSATTHWLRHSMLTHHANADVQLKTLQLTAGHSSIAMTGRYLHRDDNERHDDLMASFAMKTRHASR